ncbi:hypothetical protein NDU88_004356 [Pleurodeles waltl]|uniref:Peptidase A2 domain-containing protein n=1 Tax=Pleurodeles waltl TaxID=8319 RepID=A0AAV7TRP5_PLEWA|nr:hypothetical protein NDU88_004356 [Pleurodeles waltl]
MRCMLPNITPCPGKTSPAEKGEEEQVFLISVTNYLRKHRRPQPTCMIKVAGSTVKALIDKGALVNMMSVQQYHRLQPHPPLAPLSTKIFTYRSLTPLPLKGRMTVKVQAEGREINTTVHIFNREADALLGSQAAEERDPSLHHRPNSLVTDACWAEARYHPHIPRVAVRPIRPEQAQARRKEVNDKASKRRCAVSRDTGIGDQVIIKDRKPAWKFCTPYKPGLLTVTGVPRTMLTAEKGRDRVTQNVSWFRKATFVEPSDEPDSDDYFLDWSITGGQGQERENELPLAAGTTHPRQPVTSTLMAWDGEIRSQSARYNPPSSQRLRDFACSLML